MREDHVFIQVGRVGSTTGILFFFFCALSFRENQEIFCIILFLLIFSMTFFEKKGYWHCIFFSFLHLLFAYSILELIQQNIEYVEDYDKTARLLQLLKEVKGKTLGTIFSSFLLFRFLLLPPYPLFYLFLPHILLY